MANANNIAYLHYLASRLKTVADVAHAGDVSTFKTTLKCAFANRPPFSFKRLYKISDLAQAIIQHKRKVEGWPAGTFEGKQHLPSGLFADIDIEKQRQVRVYT